MLVLDTSVALEVAAAPARRRLLGDPRLIAPPLLWSEARSSLHERVHRGELEREFAQGMLAELESGWLESRTHADLSMTVWRIAHELGRDETYDAEVIGLARLLRCRLVTTDPPPSARRATRR